MFKHEKRALYSANKSFVTTARAKLLAPVGYKKSAQARLSALFWRRAIAPVNNAALVFPQLKGRTLFSHQTRLDAQELHNVYQLCQGQAQCFSAWTKTAFLSETQLNSNVTNHDLITLLMYQFFAASGCKFLCLPNTETSPLRNLQFNKIFTLKHCFVYQRFACKTHRRVRVTTQKGSHEQI